MRVCWHILFDRFYVVTALILPSIGDLIFSRLDYDNICAYLDDKTVHDTDSKKHVLDLMMFCKNDWTFCTLLQKTDKVIQQHHL